MSGRKPKICYVVEAASAGVGRHVGDLVERLSQRELAQIHVLWSPARADERFADQLERSGVRHQKIAMRRGLGPHDLASLTAVRGYLRRQGPFDIVHGHSSKGGALARLAAVGGRARVVYTPHAFAAMSLDCRRLKRLLYGRLERELARLADRILAVSPEERDFARRLGIAPHKLRVIPNGIEREHLPSRGAARRQLRVAGDALVVGFVGRLSPQKNPMLLLESFRRVADRFTQAQLVIIGDGPLMSQLENLIVRHRLQGRVVLAGARDGRRAMPAFDVLAMTSRYEGFPYVALEALAAGLPLVVTDTSSPRLFVDEDVNGFISPADAAPLADRLAQLLADASLRRRMGSSAAKAASFTLDQMVDEIWATYLELCPALRPARVAVGG